MTKVLFLPGYRYPASLSEPITSGDLRYTFNVSRALARAGHEVVVLTRRSEADESESELDGVRIVRYRSELGSVLATSFDISPRRSSLFKRLSRDSDVAVINTPLSIEHLSPIDTPFAYVASGLEDVKNYGATVSEFIGRVAIRSIREPLKKLTWRRACFVNTTAEGEQDTLLAWGVPEQKVVSIGPSVDLTRYTPVDPSAKPDLRKMLGLPLDRRVVLTVGRFVPAKGTLRTLDAFAEATLRASDLHLVIVGVEQGHAPRYLDSVRERIGAHSLGDRVTLLTDVPERRLPDYFAAADLTSVFSEKYDPLPTVIIESMACGTPVISTEIATRTQFIEDGVNGLFVPESDIDGWVERAMTLLHDDDLAQRLVSNARRAVVERFDSDQVAAQLLSRLEIDGTRSTARPPAAESNP